MDYLSEVERLLDMPSADKRQVMRELASHYQETRDKLVASGMDPAQAEQEAARQLGDPKETALRLNPVHCRSSWGSVILAVVPFLVVLAIRRGGLVALLTENELVQAGILILAGVYAVIVLRELIAGRRPIWLATWLAAGIGFCQALLAWSMLLGTPRWVYWIVVMSPVVVVPVCWKVPKWRTAALVVSALMVATYAAAVGIPGADGGVIGAAAVMMLWVLGPFAAWTIVGLRTFGVHRFGHPVLASLFLYTYFLISCPIQLNVLIRGPELARWDSVLLGRPGMLVAALAVLALGRAASWRTRLAVLVCGIFAWALIYSVGFGAAVFEYLWYPRMTYAIIAAFWVVVLPLVMMRSTRMERPEIVR